MALRLRGALVLPAEGGEGHRRLSQAAVTPMTMSRCPRAHVRARIGRATIEFLFEYRKATPHPAPRRGDGPAVRTAQPKTAPAEGPQRSICFFDYLARRGRFSGRKEACLAAIRTIVEDVGYWQYLLEEYRRATGP